MLFSNLSYLNALRQRLSKIIYGYVRFVNNSFFYRVTLECRCENLLLSSLYHIYFILLKTFCSTMINLWIIFVHNDAVGDRCVSALLVNDQWKFRRRYFHFVEYMHAA
jgi:hypothetical protein